VAHLAVEQIFGMVKNACGARAKALDVDKETSMDDILLAVVPVSGCEALFRTAKDHGDDRDGVEGITVVCLHIKTRKARAGDDGTLLTKVVVRAVSDRLRKHTAKEVAKASRVIGDHWRAAWRSAGVCGTSRASTQASLTIVAWSPRLGSVPEGL
jgi:hypothetical protein